MSWPEEPSEFDFRAPSIAESHAQWHQVHGQLAVCPLDCGIAEQHDVEDLDPEQLMPPAVLVTCGHCHGKHTVAGVRACSRMSHD